MTVDRYKWLPPSLKTYSQDMVVPAPRFIPWKALTKPLARARVALVIRAGRS